MWIIFVNARIHFLWNQIEDKRKWYVLIMCFFSLQIQVMQNRSLSLNKESSVWTLNRMCRENILIYLCFKIFGERLYMFQSIVEII